MRGFICAAANEARQGCQNAVYAGIAPAGKFCLSSDVIPGVQFSKKGGVGEEVTYPKLQSILPAGEKPETGDLGI